MKKRTKKILGLIAAVLVLLALIVYVLPLILLKVAIRKVLPEATRAEYITDFDRKPENTIEVDNGKYTICIPDDFSKLDVEVAANCYASEDKESKIIMILEPSADEMSLLNPEDYKDDPVMKRYGIKNVEKVFDSLGYGRPDSYYNILKGTCLLDWEDYNMFHGRKAVAFSVYAYLRAELYLDLNNFLYERDDVRAIVRFGEEENFQVDLFCTDNLNGAYTIMIKDKNITLEDVTAMLNTIEFK